MEITQVEELGQSSAKYLHSAIMSLLWDYHLSWKVDGIKIYNISGVRGDATDSDEFLIKAALRAQMTTAI